MEMLAICNLGSTHLHLVDKSRQRFGYETQARHRGEIESGLENVEDWRSSVEHDIDGFAWTAAGSHSQSPGMVTVARGGTLNDVE